MGISGRSLGNFSEDVVRLLLEHGANKDRATEGGDCPVHLAARQGHLDVLRLLLEQGARPDVAAGETQRNLILTMFIEYL